MPGSATHTFFAIPELFCLLSTYVQAYDLTQCVLVCKEWSRQFYLHLWAVLNLDDRFTTLMNVVPSPSATALARNLGLIREVIFPDVDLPHLQLLIQGLPGQVNDTVTEPGSLCTNLTRIDLCDVDAEHDHDHLDLISKPLLTLLNNNLYLTYLHVYSEITEIEGIAAALSKLLHLQHLTIDADSNEGITPEPLLFLRSCLALPELTELHFVNGTEMSWDDGDETTVRRELQAVIHETSMSNLLDLKKVEIPGFGPDTSIQEIEQVVREHCLDLKHLQCLMRVKGMVRPCALSSVVVLDFKASRHRLFMILRRMNRCGFSRSWYQGMETIEIDCQRVLSHQFQEVLTTCTQLRRFWVTAHMGPGPFSISYWDIAKGEWVCTELRELALALDRRPPEWGAIEEQEDAEGASDDPHVCLDGCSCAPKRAFQQIGRLEKLEVLQVSIDRTYGSRAIESDIAWDLTLSKGWLGELAGLKSLKSFKMRADFWRAMGQAEVEFIHEQWPSSNEVTIWCQKSSFQVEPHWQWLLDKRPQLRFAPSDY
ncbi:hypothetical protein BGZ70_002129 [Mortierella alpina]|uniref:F-box domain-containing protein n=1 Tax=Mortierella alpina TaxID=64518 RepID=A0A9P6IV35_MORAP|nr:hypothetical protein BGZ70_002129 [Mortierella alpina]